MILETLEYNKVGFLNGKENKTALNQTNLEILDNGIGDNVVKINNNFNKIASEIEDSEWSELSLNNGYSYQYSSDIPSYRKIGKIVYLKGLMRFENIEGQTVNFATLPVGFRIKNDRYARFVIPIGNSFSYVNINNDGVMSLSSLPSGATSAISLSNIQFLVD